MPEASSVVMRALPGIITLVLACAVPAATQSPAPATGAPSVSGTAQRPTIGVAFGGGAAKGFAHIRVLRWFEEHRITVDVAAGTSMGA